jgi:catechol 2,3-dioxygenase-like lactoylglutathione lyase family enzyme
MNTEEVNQRGSDAAGRAACSMRLEVVVVPVADVDRAKSFYEGLGWRVDYDLSGGGGFRLVQVTPTLSPTSISFGSGITKAAPGSIDTLLLAVDDIEAARSELVARGVEASEVFHGAGAGFRRPGPGATDAGRDPEGSSYSSWVSFCDPDGNGWLLQEVTARPPGRLWDTDA